MNLDLTAVRAKLSRSQEHVQSAQRECRAWIDRHPYSLTKQVNDDSTRYSIFLRENEPAPLLRWTLMVGDCLNNLRSALDYLVYAVAIADTGKNPPLFEKKLQFPITSSRSEFDEVVGRRKQLGEISNPVMMVFESLQPYNRPHKTLPPVLGILRDLNNTDKHRLIRLAYGAVSKGNFGFQGAFPPDGRIIEPVANQGEVKDGTEVFAMVCDRPTPDMQWDQTILEIVVAIWHGKRDPSGPDWSSHTESGALIEEISAEVRHCIYAFAKII